MKPDSSSRRKALSSMLGGILLARAGTDEVGRETRSESGFRIRRRHYVTPPGSGEIKEFASKCTGCHLCVNACPTGVIQPAQNELGWQNFMRVRLDFNAGYCNYECTRCMEICPTGALLPVPTADKKRTQIGKAKFVKENCIIIAEGTDCGACAEHCPTGAVRMVPHKNDIRIPEVEEDICIGCGACEHACPSQPYKAIYVEGNKVHVIAEEPRKGEKAQETEFEGDFPF